MTVHLPVARALCLAAAAGTLGAQIRVTSPIEQFGHEIGADYVLPNYQQLVAYCQKLEAESDPMKRVSIGRTAEERIQYISGSARACGRSSNTSPPTRRRKGCAASPGPTATVPSAAGGPAASSTSREWQAPSKADVGKGKLFLFGPEITVRGQPHGTFKFLFNGIYYGTAQRSRP